MTERELVIECEEALIGAIKNNDIQELDRLLHEDLIFINPHGETITKQIDLETYLSGKVKISSIQTSEQQILILNGTAVVAVVVDMKGQYVEHSLDGKYHYMRIWKNIDHSWKVVAGSCIGL